MDFTETWKHTSSSVSAAIDSEDNELFERLLSENCSVDVADNRGWRPLHVAAFAGNLSAITRLMLHDDNVIDWATFEGETALWLATKRRHYKICVHLLESGAQANIANNEQESPLHLAARNGDFKCTQLLLKHGAKVEAADFCLRTPIHDAALGGHTEVVNLLLKQGADARAKDEHGIVPLFTAAQSGVLSCLRLLHHWTKGSFYDDSARDGTTPLMIAAQEGSADCVRYLLDNGWDADETVEDGATALHIATQKGHLNCVKELYLRTGKDALLKACYGSVAANFTATLPGMVYLATGSNKREIKEAGISFLHLAISYERLDILEYFLESGANPNLYVVHEPIDWGRFVQLEGNFLTALGLACYKLNRRAIDILLKHGADIKMCEGNVLNPLYCALKSGCDLQFARYLIERGALINSRAMYYEDCPALYITFKNPELFCDMLALGAWLHGGIVHHVLESPFTLKIVYAIWTSRKHWNESGMIESLTVLANYLPRLGCIMGTYKKMFCIMHQEHSVNEDREHFDKWRSLFKLIDCAESLRGLCRRAVRQKINSSGRDLQMKVATLQLPQNVRDYLLFR